MYLEASQEIPVARAKARAIKAVTRLLAETGDADGLRLAIEMAATIADERWKSDALYVPTVALGQLGDPFGIRLAQQFADEIDGAYDRAHALCAVGHAFLQSNEFDEALNACESAVRAYSLVQGKDDRDSISPDVEGAYLSCIRAVFSNFAEAHDIERMRDHSRQTLSQAELWPAQLRAEGAAIEALARAGALDAAAELTRLRVNAASETGEPSAMALIAACVAHAYRLVNPERARNEAATALRWVSEISAEDQRGYCLTSIALPLVQTGLGEETLECAQSIRDKSWGPCLSAIALASADGFDGDLALRAASAISGQWLRDMTLAGVAYVLATTGRGEQALVVAKTITDSEDRNATMKAVALCLARSGAVQEALQAILAIDKKSYQDEGLAEIAHIFARTGATNTAWSVWETLEAGSGSETAQAFRSLLDESLQNEIHSLVGRGELKQATVACSSTNNKYSKALTLREILRAYVSIGNDDDIRPIRQLALEETNRAIQSCLPSNTDDAYQDALRAIAKVLAGTPWAREAIALCTKVSDSSLRSELQKTLAGGPIESVDRPQPWCCAVINRVRQVLYRRRAYRTGLELQCRLHTADAVLRSLPLLEDISVRGRARLFAVALGGSEGRASALGEAERRLQELRHQPNGPQRHTVETAQASGQATVFDSRFVARSRMLVDTDSFLTDTTELLDRSRWTNREAPVLMRLVSAQQMEETLQTLKGRIGNLWDEVPGHLPITNLMTNRKYEEALQSALVMQPGRLERLFLLRILADIAHGADSGVLDKCIQVAQTRQSRVMCRREVLCQMARALLVDCRLEEARRCFAQALMLARTDGKQWVFVVLAAAADALASLDNGHTLLLVYESLIDVETWWPWQRSS